MVKSLLESDFGVIIWVSALIALKNRSQNEEKRHKNHILEHRDQHFCERSNFEQKSISVFEFDFPAQKQRKNEHQISNRYRNR